MKTVVWQSLTKDQQQQLLARPAVSNSTNITAIVSDVINQVRQQGDQALLALTEKFDGLRPATLNVSSSEVNAACARLNDEMKAALEQAHRNITTFHLAQQQPTLRVETQPGVICEQVTRPVSSVGLYIPGGSAPLPSTVLMLGVPAQIAGCRQITLCSPPPIADEILYVAKLCGINDIYNVGGSQAIAAMAYGTETIASVDKIFDPEMLLLLKPNAKSVMILEARRLICQQCSI